MTIQEAIERFEYVKANATHQKDAGVSEYWQQEIDATIEAINMAIEALQNADRKTEPSKEQNFCGKCRYLYRDFKYGLSCYRLMDNEPCKYEDRKTEPTGYNLSPVEDEPQTDVYDYKGNGKWERSE